MVGAGDGRPGWAGRGRLTTAAVAAAVLGAVVTTPAPATGQLLPQPSDPVAELHEPTPVPDRVVLTPTATPATSQSVTWRTSALTSSPRAQIVEALPGPSETRGGPRLDALATTVTDVSSSSVQTGLRYRSRYHTATFEGLEPATAYLYRVGDGANWSEWYEFRTAADGFEPFSFIYVGDAQNDVREHVSRVFRRAYADQPDARLFLHAGDLVNTADDDLEWGDWFSSSGWINGMVNVLATPGNHEYRSGLLSPQWRPQFAFPSNGPAAVVDETTYYVDYQGVRFISLDSNHRNHGALSEIATWLDQVLTDNPHKWAIVFHHHPVFSVGEGRNEVAWRNAVLPILEEHGVDLVLQGHDHSYGRGNLAANDSRSGRSSDGPVYVVSVSGPKMYEVSGDVWRDYGATLRSTAENTQLYQLIEVERDRILYEARDATGALHDAFVITKQDDGRRTVSDRRPLG